MSGPARVPPVPVLEVAGLRKRYGMLDALAGLNFQVHAGEIVGLLGPNGAGKTSTIESIAGLVQPDGGTIRLCEEALDRQGRGRIGLALQATALQDAIRPREALALFARLYRVRPDLDALLRRFGLVEQAERLYGQLSGGQKQRLALALAFVNDPALILLDEPTAGLDPAARSALHDLIRQLAADGCAVLLATHDMAEAERLCDRLLVIDKGIAIAEGEPVALIGGERDSVLIEGRADRPLDGLLLPSLPDLTVSGPDFRCRTTDPNRTMAAIIAAIDDQGARLTALHLGRVSLEETILSLTGKGPLA